MTDEDRHDPMRDVTRMLVEHQVAEYMSAAAIKIEKALLVVTIVSKPELIVETQEKLWVALRETVMLVVTERGARLRLIRDRLGRGEMTPEEAHDAVARIMKEGI